MKRFALMPLLMVSAMPTTSLAQVRGQNMVRSPQAILRDGDGYLNQARNFNYDRIARGASRECLEHRKTGRTVCLYRSEWEDVAKGRRDWNGKRLRS
jgi:hypothetical protein